ncbi:MAG: pyridoxamine 5'-phosphate oxidase family protein [Clostridia bacterium]|nr:pyridoxamine 5'-phosphate oxidase family protein [Clostridia bacterium]
MTTEIKAIMDERFGHDTLLSVATAANSIPYVRIVDAYYENGVFYAVTYSLSNKMNQIKNNPIVAVCGEWFTARGIGENLGHIRDKRNAKIAAKLRAAFASWYDNGHTDENDPNTCILCIKLTEGVLFHNGTRYDINFKDEYANE